MFWAAEQVIGFTDDDIRTLVSTGSYTDPAASSYLTNTLIARRNIIGKALLARPLMVSDFRVDGNRVLFRDLAVRYGYVTEEPAYRYRWSVFYNDNGQSTMIDGAVTEFIPEDVAPFLRMDISTGNESRRVTVYLKRTSSRHKVVGIERVL
jgi:hypothetical protein